MMGKAGRGKLEQAVGACFKEINHYMKVAKAIRLTIELQGKIDDVYGKMVK
jgi:hypothetical protein